TTCATCSRNGTIQRPSSLTSSEISCVDFIRACETECARRMFDQTARTIWKTVPLLAFGSSAKAEQDGRADVRFRLTNFRFEKTRERIADQTRSVDEQDELRWANRALSLVGRLRCVK